MQNNNLETCLQTSTCANKSLNPQRIFTIVHSVLHSLNYCTNSKNIKIFLWLPFHLPLIVKCVTTHALCTDLINWHVLIGLVSISKQKHMASGSWLASGTQVVAHGNRFVTTEPMFLHLISATVKFVNYFTDLQKHILKSIWTYKVEWVFRLYFTIFIILQML